MISFSNFALLRSSVCSLTRNTASLFYAIVSSTNFVITVIIVINIIIIVNLILESGINLLNLIRELEQP
jgi:hypothetical protein